MKTHSLLALPIGILLAASSAYTRPSAATDWPQWGGAARNFHIEGVDLADSWPEEGPSRLWKQPLGDGYAGVAVVGDLLFTMYRADDHEHTVALKKSSGESIWTHHYPAPFLPKTDLKPGPGPHATPLIVDGKVFAAGVTGKLHALEAESGTVVWSKDLVNDFGGTVLYRGYSASPIAFSDSVIVTVGGDVQGVVAFRQSDGGVKWKSGDFQISHSSPILIRFADEDQLVVYASELIVGLNPETGATIWTHEQPTRGGYIASMPVWEAADSRIYFSCAYDGGSRCLQLSNKDGKTEVSELWFTRRMRVHHSNVIRVGDHVYGSSGDFGPNIFTAITVSSGEIEWQDRRFGRSGCIYVDHKLIALDEEGTLSLAKVSPQGLEILSRIRLFEGRAWTPPTLVGKTLFIRNRTDIMAYALP